MQMRVATWEARHKMVRKGIEAELQTPDQYRQRSLFPTHPIHEAVGLYESVREEKLVQIINSNIQGYIFVRMTMLRGPLTLPGTLLKRPVVHIRPFEGLAFFHKNPPAA